MPSAPRRVDLGPGHGARRPGAAWLRLRAPLAWAAGLCWLIGAWHLAVAPLPLLTRIESAFADLRLSLVCPPVERARSDIVIVDVDDASLRAVGRWPWPRDRLGRLIDVLFDDDRIGALGIDLLFAEGDDQAGAVGDALRTLQRLAPADGALQQQAARWRAELLAQADHDARLARALQGRAVTLAYHFNHQAAGGGPADDGPAPVADPAVLPASALALPPWRGRELPVPTLRAAAAGTGFINSLPDADGELRATPLVAAYAGAVYESFGLSLWRQWRHAAYLQPVLAAGVAGAPARLTALRLEDAQGTLLRLQRVDERGAVLLPYRRARVPGASPGTGRFRYIPAIDVLEHRVGAAELQGRLVLLGSSAPGLTDLRPTPVHQALPGIEVHAQLLAGLQDGDLAVEPDWAPGLMLLVLAGVLAAVVLIVARLPAPYAVAAVLALMLLLGLANLAAFAWRGWAWPLAAPACATLLIGVTGLVANYLREWQGRRSLARLFGHYLPPERVRAMASDPERFLDLASSAENRELTILFCDLRGFTPMAEWLAPERLREVLNLYFSRMSEIIHAHGGTLDKFIGDAVMAFWGAPEPDPAHAAHAVRAAEAMCQAVGPLNAELAARGLPAVVPCLGLATGVVCVGDLGSRRRRSYTAVGDGVNLAARIEGLTREWSVPLLVADTTRQAAGELPGSEWVEVEPVTVKGRHQPVTLFVPITRPSGPMGENAAFHEQLGLWRLAQAALAAHHRGSAPAHPSGRAEADTDTAVDCLTRLLQVRPAAPQLQALAAHLLDRLAGSHGPYPPSDDPPRPTFPA